ncbi:hypothetical protein Hanom_Chr12g01070691 [Helianthus anomalus]
MIQFKMKCREREKEREPFSSSQKVQEAPLKQPHRSDQSSTFFRTKKTLKNHKKKVCN